MLTGPVVLRLFTQSDAPGVRELAGGWAVAKSTASLPHPYRQAMAEDWISGHDEARNRGADLPYAVTRVHDGTLVGSLGLHPRANEHGHFGYRIGRPHWGLGNATAATRAAIALPYAHTDAEALWAVHLADNHGSSRVMEKCGMRVLRHEARPHRGESRDFLVRGITRDEWDRPADRPR